MTSRLIESKITSIDFLSDEVIAQIKPIEFEGRSISSVKLYNNLYASEIGADLGSRILVKAVSDGEATLKSVLTQMPYSGPELPNKYTIGPVISVDLDEVYALLK